MAIPTNIKTLLSGAVSYTHLAGGCGDTNGKPQIDKTNHLNEAYKFGKNIYRE